MCKDSMKPIDMRGKPMTLEMFQEAAEVVRNQPLRPDRYFCPRCHRELVLKDCRYRWGCTCYADQLRDSR